METFLDHLGSQDTSVSDRPLILMEDGNITRLAGRWWHNPVRSAVNPHGGWKLPYGVVIIASITSSDRPLILMEDGKSQQSYLPKNLVFEKKRPF